MRASIDQCGKQREAGLSGEISLDNTPNPLPCYSSKSAVIVSKSRADPWGELRWEAARRKGGHRGRTGSNSLESSVGMERGGSMDIVDGQETVGNSLGKAPVGGSETEAWTSWTDRKTVGAWEKVLFWSPEWFSFCTAFCPSMLGFRSLRSEAN